MTKTLSPARVRAFRKKIYNHYDNHGRDLPWRKTTNPYYILVSEIMLQQTQVDRVIPKYREFLDVFPDFQTLADAPLQKLLAVWSGMGYNRRALALRDCARKVVDEHGGRLPSDADKLMKLPGIGKYTTGAVCAFAFNQPVLVLDTNIRRVFIHAFFPDRDSIEDDEIIPLVRQTLDDAAPARWYNALMDYGAVLGKGQKNPNRKSAHYVKQSPFAGSNRQVRGTIMKLLVKETALTAARIVKMSGMDAERVKKNLADLEREGFIRKQGRRFSL